MFSYIKKIDDPARFAAIRTGITNIAYLPPDEQDKLSTWINALKVAHPFELNENQLQWTIRNIRPIWEHIQSYENQNTMRSHMSALANILLAINKHSQAYVSLARTLWEVANRKGAAISAANADNRPDAEFLKNYVPYPALVIARDALAKSDQKSHANRMRYLLMCLATYIPPLRLDWLDMKIYRNKRPPRDDDSNYLWAYAPGKYSIVMNHDKIEARRREAGKERMIVRLDDELKGVTDGETLNRIIDASLAAEPRDYVLTNGDGSPMAASTYNSILSQLFAPHSPTQNMLRKAYINYWYADDKKLTEAQLKQIAERMRHTTETARASYRKIDLPTEHAIPLANLPADRKARQREASQRFRENHPDFIRRSKLLWSINTGQRAPRPNTIEKYKLFKDASGKWRSHLDSRTTE